MGLTFPLSPIDNLKFDSNNNVLANVNAQNFNPNVNTVASVTGAVGSVTGAVGSVTNPVTSWVTISHQTGLSAAVSTANAPVNIGSAISITKDGKIQIACSGYVSAGVGAIRIARTRSTVVDYINQNTFNETSTTVDSSLFTDGGDVSINLGLGFKATARVRLLKAISNNTTLPAPASPDVIEIEVLNGDSLQFQVSNNTASTTIYIDDLVVQQQ